MTHSKDPHRLEIYSETLRSRIFVGTLWFATETQIYTFEYDRSYLRNGAIPLGPDLPLRRRVHQSKKNSLFLSLEDRIPSRENPAYADYCKSMGVAVDEKNKIILLATIGRRGPSTFIFESVFLEEAIGPTLVKFRKQLDLTTREFSAIFDLNYPTVNKIEKGKSKDRNSANLVRLYMNVPEAGWRCVLTNQRKIHSAIARRLIRYFREKIDGTVHPK